MGAIRAGKVQTSARLQNTAKLLRRAGSHGLTTREISQATGSMAVHSDLSALRANGYEIRREEEGRTPDGGRVNRYFLVYEPPTLAALLTGYHTLSATPSEASPPLPSGPVTIPGEAEGGAASLAEDEDLEALEEAARADLDEEEEDRERACQVCDDEGCQLSLGSLEGEPRC